MAYEPGETSVRKLIEAVRGTVKYAASLETPVVTTVPAREGKWTAFAEPAVTAVGSEGRLVLRLEPSSGGPLPEFEVELVEAGGLVVGAASRPTPREWTASFAVPRGCGHDELLAFIRIRGDGECTTSLVIVVPVAPAR